MLEPVIYLPTLISDVEVTPVIVALPEIVPPVTVPVFVVADKAYSTVAYGLSMLPLPLSLLSDPKV